MLVLFLNTLDSQEDARLFEDIFYSYRKQMHTLAMSYLHNETDAEDAVHDVFLNIVSKHIDIIRQIKSESDLRNYMLKATKNTALNMLKHNNRMVGQVSEYDISNMPELTDNDFTEFIIQRVRYNEILTAIKALDEKYRDVLYLHFVAELSVPHTAKLLGRKVSAVKKQLIRGKKMLLYILKNEGVI